MVENKENNYIYGKNPVCEILQNNPKRINKIYIQKNFSYDNRLKKIVELAKEHKIIIGSFIYSGMLKAIIKHIQIIAIYLPLNNCMTAFSFQKYISYINILFNVCQS